MRVPLFIFAMLLLQPAEAQLLPIRNYTTREGLNANGIYAILRDSKGVLWVGTYNGVNWYDGSRFIQPPMSTRSGQIYVTSFREDSARQVWVTSWYSGLYKFSEGRFTNYLPDTVHIESQSNSLFDLLELGGGRYLAATDQNVWLFNGHHFTLFDPHNPALQQQILTLAKTPRGDILIGYGRGVVWYRRTGSNGYVYAGKLFDDLGVNKILITGQECWIATARGLRFCPDLDDAMQNPGGSSGAFIEKGLVDNIFIDREKNIWFTGEGGLHKFNMRGNTPSAEQIYTPANGLPSSAVRAIYTDQEGITWLGTDYGLAKLNENYYRFYPIQDEDPTQPDNKGDASIIAISDDRLGRLWLGSYEGIYRMQHAQAFESRPRDPAQHGGHAGFTYSMRKDRAGTLWACTATGVYTIGSGGLEKRSPQQIVAMDEDKEGDLWFGAMDGKIYTLRDHEGSGGPDGSGGPGGLCEVPIPKLINEKINALYRDPAGFFWVGYALTGVRKYRLAPDGHLELVKEFTGRNGFENLRVRSFCDDRRGHLLVGTRTDGIYVFDWKTDATIAHINTGSQLGGNWVKAAAIGGRQVYLATNNGLDILDADNYTAKPKHIAFRNDAVPVEFNTVYLQGDTVWLGTAKGVLEYTPFRQQKNTLPPPAYIMKVTIDGSVDSLVPPFSMAGELPKLSYRQNNIAFDFAGLSFLDEENVRYTYRMEGLDKDWSPVTDRRYVNYSHLSPGTYRFRVSAQNNDGVWSEVPASMSFIIATPFWQTWWFLSLVVVTLAALMYAFYRYRLQQALQIERLRVKISTDLHDDIGSTLSSISILSDIVLREAGQEQHQGMVQEIKESSISLMEKMDDIVWSINPRNDELESLMLRIKRFAAQLFEAKGIDYEIDIENSIRHLKLPMEHRQSVYLIMKEAINNLVKYADAGRAFIRAESEGQFLRVQISDDGKGFVYETVRTGNGIANMKSRADLMGATLHLSSSPGKGTTVILTLKMK
ncbi:MAG: two-component regulator propeller domain-containing protein [Bacteroidota bacterium]|nr:two-component regulator propeller domain-containing protein [Bacteroidota bacterium]MDP4253688.1 two-component regulator propeller domain-containing protein [Bacteroidota bacterium]MDP4259972.1 two-component regulator propeller domain-containing protein [Bacteroidota bacterium]